MQSIPPAFVQIAAFFPRIAPSTRRATPGFVRIPSGKARSLVAKSVSSAFVLFVTSTGHGQVPASPPITPETQVSDEVTWSIGTASSSIDGGAGTGPVEFTWKFNAPVEHGTYLDGTPWVIWKPGLQLTAVSPTRTKTDLPDHGSIRRNAVTDATVIDLDENGLALDERMGDTAGNGPWDHGTDVWNGEPVDLGIGDCIVTGRGRRDDRGSGRRMVFTAIGVCNVVAEGMTGRYRPPIRMPADLRAGLAMPGQVDVLTLPTFELADPRDWSGSRVDFDLSRGLSAADLLNGPMGNCGIDSHVWYETANGLLNHDLSGTDNVGYQRNVADRFAACLHTAFDPDEDPDLRQRSLDKFIQGGLDYYLMHCLGYPVWNGGGGHPDGVEDIITLTGALLGDGTITDAIKYQRFPGSAVGRPGVVIDMLSGNPGAFTRSEATHLLSPAAWKSGDFVRRTVGDGAANLDETIIRIDFAREDMVINNDDLPFTAVETVDDATAVTIDADFAWPMYTENKATEAKRSYRYLPGAVVRLAGDDRVRKVIEFKRTPTSDWAEDSWASAGGTGGVLLIHPALSTAELATLGPTGRLTTGVSTRAEAEADEVVLWESWPLDGVTRARRSFFASPVQDYLGNKLGDHLQWLPYYHLLDDPGAAGKKLHEESPTYHQVRRFVVMQRDFGRVFWNQFIADPNLPKTPEIQALVRHYLLDDTMPSVFCKTYGPGEKMWTDQENPPSETNALIHPTLKLPL